MKTYTMGDFLDDKNIDDHGFSLYVVRKIKYVLYIGKAVGGIRNRWFNSSWGHLPMNIYGERYDNSLIGKKILKNLPYSRKWHIDFYTLEECREIVHQFISPTMVKISVEYAEIALIRKLNPSLNYMNS